MKAVRLRTSGKISKINSRYDFPLVTGVVTYRPRIFAQIQILVRPNLGLTNNVRDSR